MREIQDLTDHPYILSTHAVEEIATAIETEFGRKPNLQEVCDVIGWGIQASRDDLLGDVQPGRVEKIVCKLRPAKVQRLAPGDVIAIPDGIGKNYLGVYLTKNRFGHAFGFFRGHWARRPPGKTCAFERCGIPIYTGLRAVCDGSWYVLGNRPDLLTYFDGDPEIYHQKRHRLDDPSIGEFGAAERASGDLRSIDKKEATRVGLLDGSYRVVVLESYVADELERRGC